jgi:hypothetical protein
VPGASTAKLLTDILAFNSSTTILSSSKGNEIKKFAKVTQQVNGGIKM